MQSEHLLSAYHSLNSPHEQNPTLRGNILAGSQVRVRSGSLNMPDLYSVLFQSKVFKDIRGQSQLQHTRA